MKKLHIILATSIFAIMGMFLAPQVQAKRTTELTAALGTLSEFTVTVGSNHRAIEKLNLAQDTNKTTHNVTTAYRHFISTINALIGHYTFFTENTTRYDGDSTWVGNKENIIDFYVRTKTELIADIRLINGAITHALTHARDAERKQLVSFQTVISILNVWITKDLGDVPTTRAAIIEHVGSLVKLNQDLHAVAEKTKNSSSFLWRAVKAIVKLTVFGFAVYGIDCATGGFLSSLVAASGYDYHTAVTTLCSLPSLAGYLPAAICTVG